MRRLKLLGPTINEICSISGCAGASVGVLHHKKVVFTEGYGFRDVENKIKPDQHTIYYMASLTKAFTAAMVGILVEQGKLQWTTPIAQILPAARQKDATIREKANIIDWMSHRTGLAPYNHIWSQEYGHWSLRRRDAIPTINNLEKVFDFRTRWLYSNWGYAIADEITQKLTRETWGTALRKEIFEPLGLNRTITKHDTDLDNVAKSYMALENGRPFHLPRPFPEDGTVMEGAVAVQSNVADLLKFYGAIMEAGEHQAKHGATSTPGSPLKQVPTLLANHIALSPKPSEREQSYALGWVRAELPGSLGKIGLNPAFLEMPEVGKGLEQPVLCLYHQGSTNTFLNSVHLLPESHSGVVVLTNSMANNDCADWLGEMILETLLDNPHKNKYVSLAKASSEVSKSLWPKMRDDLERDKTPNTRSKQLSAYVGIYWNAINTYCIEVLLKNEKLMMCFQGDHEQLYELEHYHYDVFSWLLTHDEDVRRGRFPVTRATFYLLSFKQSENPEEIDSLAWVNDSVTPRGEIFVKEQATKLAGGEDSVARTEGPA